MKDFCENPCCENPGVKEVPVSARDPSDQLRTLCAPCEEAYTWGVQHGAVSAQTKLAMGGVDRLLENQCFVVLAKNSTDPSSDGPFEAWAYTGPLDFEVATPVRFGAGTDITGALRALAGHLVSGRCSSRTPRTHELTPLPISKRELATILAALRFHQDENLCGVEHIADEAIKQIATDGGLLEALSSDEVDELCEKINVGGRPVHRGIQRIHDLLYLDMVDDQERYNPDKPWEADTLAMIAEIIAEYIPRPAQPSGSQQ